MGCLCFVTLMHGWACIEYGPKLLVSPVSRVPQFFSFGHKYVAHNLAIIVFVLCRRSWLVRQARDCIVAGIITPWPTRHSAAMDQSSRSNMTHSYPQVDNKVQDQENEISCFYFHLFVCSPQFWLKCIHELSSV